jgi:hypothetical protein
MSSGALDVAGEVALPIAVLVNFYQVIQATAEAAEGARDARLQRDAVYDFADILSAWVFGGSNRHAQRLRYWHAMQLGAASSWGADAGYQRAVEALGGARRQAASAFAEIRRRHQQAALRAHHRSQHAMYVALAREAAARQGVTISAEEMG